ncbi:MAG: UDP-N-acetylglucosamine 2-epimerase (non-hydrolyzing) [Anaerolineales bacterium]|nr:UDP-N-acetylglucosamine 2-epimerase (non-hydrolyzing) [Anaerolineales bacterium]
MADRPLRVLSIFGTRPEAVKMAPVVARLQQMESVHSQVCVTAQHREMLDQVLALFSIHPDYDLNLMKPNQTLAGLTAAVFERLDPVLEKAQPDWVLVQGDTTTVMAAALGAYYHQIKVGHVEAGLRTGDKWQPFPEEINRRIAGAVADLHFAPTDWARRNLLKENVPEDSILVTGNTVIDALQEIAARPFAFDSGPLAGLNPERRVILVTAHRRENFGKPLLDILTALRQIAETYPDTLTLVYPVHLNPNVREPAYAQLGSVPNILLTEPLDYLSMVHLMKRSVLVLTDSGGLQEEAPALGKPVLVLREKTERPEAVKAGTARLVGTDPVMILGETRRLLEDPEAYNSMAKAINPFGDGHAAERITKALLAN